MRKGAKPAKTRSPKFPFNIRNRQVGSGAEPVVPEKVDLGSSHLITVDLKEAATPTMPELPPVTRATLLFRVESPSIICFGAFLLRRGRSTAVPRKTVVPRKTPICSVEGGTFVGVAPIDKCR